MKIFYVIYLLYFVFFLYLQSILYALKTNTKVKTTFVPKLRNYFQLQKQILQPLPTYVFTLNLDKNTNLSSLH